MLLAIPVFNEESNLTLFFESLFPKLPSEISQVLFINDGSSDHSAQLLESVAKKNSIISIVHHTENQGYGQAMITAMNETKNRNHRYLITMDCDRQHRPEDIQRFIDFDLNIDVVSGSRYLPTSRTCGQPPTDRVEVNTRITKLLNKKYEWQLTDSFCGFKRYNMNRINASLFTEKGYAFPMEFWAYSATTQLSIQELAVSRIYTTDSRSFGEDLDRTRKRYQYYLKVFYQSQKKFQLLKK